jgi:hypothetical protein
MKAFLEHFAAIIGAFTVAVFAMSWCHEYGYFWVIGRQFQTFLTTTDYLTNVVLWLPLAVLFLYFYGEWSYLKDEEPKKSDWSTRKTMVAASMIILITLGFFTAISWPPDLWSFGMLLFFVIVVWSAIWRKFVPVAPVEEPFAYVLKNVIRVAPPLLIGIFIYGLVNANQDLTGKYDPYAFQFKGQPTAKLLFFLRNFDRGALVRDQVDNKMTFYRWEDIEAISRTAGEIYGPMTCWMFPSWCSRPLPITP